MAAQGTLHRTRRRVLRRWAAAAAGGLAAAGTVAAAPATAVPRMHRLPTCKGIGELINCTYQYTGAEQVFAVPSGVTAVLVTAVGGSGGSPGGSFGGTAGRAARVTARVPVAPGSTLFVEVGGAVGASGAIGGWNGGGSSVSGGGASDVRTVSRPPVGPQTTSLQSRLLVAGGGGGGGVSGTCNFPSATLNGGNGGDANGNGTGAATTCAGLGTSTGGTAGGAPPSISGGVHGTNTPGGPAVDGTDGTLGFGADAAGGGGAGGGGYNGGGSGADTAADAAGVIGGSGGGGGSSLVPSGGTVQAPTYSPPGVTISYAPVRTPADLVISMAGPGSVRAGSHFTVTITLSNRGPGGALGVITVLRFPPFLRVISVHGVSIEAGRIQWAAQFASVGSVRRYQAQFAAPPGIQRAVMFRVSTSSVWSPDPVPGDNEATIRVRIQRA